MRRRVSFLIFLFVSISIPSWGQSSPLQQTLPSRPSAPSQQVQVAPPVRTIEAPSQDASAEELERQGDQLRGEKNFLDAMDYFRAALKKNPTSPSLFNKIGIVNLQTHHLKEAKKNFERSTKLDKKFADGYNNLAVAYYYEKKYNKAIKLYTKAIDLRQDAASFFNNLGAAYFAKKEFEKAVQAYAMAVQLDPDVLERSSRTGVSAQLPSPEDRAKYDYVIARLYAKQGLSERALQYLRRAMEEGYKDIKLVYKDEEFAGLRKDPRFTELMAAKPPAIPE
jgi:tetratricopeptide (TPR) repeat protein